MGEIVNTYMQGINRDIANTKQNNEQYYSAQNLRVVSTEGRTSGVLENVKGNKCKYVLESYIGDDRIVIGHGVIRDELVLFATDEINSYIYKATYDDTDSIKVATLIYSDQLAVGKLGFSINYPIDEVVCKYETSTIKHIYWADGYHQLRYCNIEKLSLSPLYPDDITLFNIVADVTLNEPVIDEITKGGYLKTGMYEYAYQLYNPNSSYTKWSAPSALIHIVKESDIATTDANYIGDEIGTETGKAVRVQINNIDSRHTRIRVASIFYSEILTAPLINIIKEDAIVGDTYNFIDDGYNYIGTLTTDEFITLGGEVIIPKTITTKDELLIAGNIKREYFELNYDARAYRYNKANQLYLWNLDNTEHIEGSGPTYNYHKIDGTVEIITLSQIPETFDCINKFNDLAYDLDRDKTTGVSSNAEFKFKGIGSNVGQIGGIGVNIEYGFIMWEATIDEHNDCKKTFTTSPNTSITGSIIDRSYKNPYTNPYNCTSLKGYARDEIYRFGIVFIDSKGRQSFVNWIGDIRFPRDGEYLFCINTGITEPNKISFLSGTKVKTHILGIEFYVNNIPINPETSQSYPYKIVRCERKTKDKTVVAQGYVQPFDYSNSFQTNVNQSTMGLQTYQVLHESDHGFGNYAKGGSGGTIIQWQNVPTTFEMVSPEFVYDDTHVVQSGDYIEAIGTMVLGGIPIGYDTTDLVAFMKFKTITYNNRYKFPIKQAQIHRANSQNATDFNDGLSTYKYLHFCYEDVDDSRGKYTLYGDRGQALVGVIDRTIIFNDFNKLRGHAPYLPNTGYYDFNILYANYRRPLTNQYGGKTYTDRTRNEYISCSNYQNSGSCIVFNGDVFINMFDYQRVYASLDASAYYMDISKDTLTYALSVIFPCQTIFNTTLSLDKPLNREVGNRWMKQQTAGNWTSITEPDYSYAQPYDMFSYNTVYSRNSNLIKYYAKPFDFDNSITINEISSDDRYYIHRDCEIITTDKKVSGEMNDTWTVFKTNNYIDADSQYGPINRLIQYKNNVIGFQDKGIFSPAINQQSLIQDSTATGQLTLGTGGILTRIDYISQFSGTQSKNSIFATSKGIYYFDDEDKKIKIVTDTDISISETKGVNSFLYNNYLAPTIANPYNTVIGYGINTGFDSKNNELLFSMNVKYNGYITNLDIVNNQITIRLENNEFVPFSVGGTYFIYGYGYDCLYITGNNNILTFQYDGGSNPIPILNTKVYIVQDTTLVYNELIEAFTGFYNYYSSMNIGYNGKLMTIPPASTGYLDSIYVHNEGLRGNFYNLQYPSRLFTRVNADGKTTVQFNNMEFLSEVYSNDVNLVDETITSIRVLNDYQDTNTINLIPNNNIVRRFRKWRLNVPRDFDYVNNIMTRSRIRDTYAMVELNFDNNNDKKIVLHDLTTKAEGSNF